MNDAVQDEPAASQQIVFLRNLQRLFSEGSFVATYKFALLSALADLSVEKGRDDDGELLIETKDIAAKFIGYYWRQVLPFTARGAGTKPFVLRHATGRQAGVVRLLLECQEGNIKTLSELRSSPPIWNRVLGEVNGIIKEMPLWKLQTMGSVEVDFLYENVGHGNSIRLKHGVMYCFRAFHTFITDMIRGAWTRFVRQLNHQSLGATADLDEFLFGSERASLSGHAPILYEIQSGRCFYCGQKIDASDQNVDHFIPWATYPFDLGHNFVLTDRRCNGAKSHHLASVDHLRRWAIRNWEHGDDMSLRFDEKSISHDLFASQTIAEWAYHQGFVTHAQTYSSGYGANRVFEPIPINWTEGIATAQP